MRLFVGDKLPLTLARGRFVEQYYGALVRLFVSAIVEVFLAKWRVTVPISSSGPTLTCPFTLPRGGVEGGETISFASGIAEECLIAKIDCCAITLAMNRSNEISS